MDLQKIIKIFEEHGFNENNCSFFRQEDITDIAKEIEADFYFAHPYRSWERAINENTNGLIRQFFPKSHDFSKITKAEIETVVNLLNNRPRKSLGFKTPNEIFWSEVT